MAVAVNEMVLAEQPIENTPDNNLTMFDRDFYSLGLLHKWANTGVERHWLIPLKKNVQYGVVRKLGQQDKLVKLNSSARARKLWPDLANALVVRVVSRNIQGKQYDVLTYFLPI
ncbi:hypothetical protein N482_22070 [Pseudoalteromonas luteoviolacea NCIMB 1942]|uniref:Transposase IS4-like domain-containing protein n=1 Tax=Pseudoalteromonas luteoviolacea NCIMB 1942 TaxID=1365253 RepID=A0A167HTA5_9GAMM|nr:hypothetical protein N482_22070 [Pseudoalteromonas luteoviolacea NCIMB 1942]